jgi:tetratricopeptide (TPR) repeat protein
MSSSSPQPSLERFCTTCGARKQADSTNEAVMQYCASCGAAQYAVQFAVSENTTQSGAPSASKLLAMATIVVILVGSASFGITRYIIDKPAANAASQNESQAANGSASGNPSGGASANPMSKVSPEIQQRIADVQDSLSKDPKNGGLVVRMANAWYDAGAYFQAEQYYARYLKEFNPKDVAARIDYAYTILRQGREDEAIAETKRALEFEPKRVEAIYNLGVIYYGKKDFKSAKEWFEKCIEIAPDTEVAKSAKEIIKGIAANNQGS